MSTPHSRRDVLKGAVAVAAVASFPRRAAGQESTMQARTRIDGVLKRAVDAKDVPGVVAMAATDKGVLYEGAFGLRALDTSAPMTLDTVFRIASMTKAITSVAAMQLVEQGRLKLDEPVPNVDPALASPQVLDGFDASGAPILRSAKRPITLRHLLTHTAGFSYDIWNADTGRYIKATGMPARATAKVASIRTPLAFDPGELRARGTEPPQHLFPRLCRLGLPACHGILGRDDDPTQQFHGGSQLRVNLLARRLSQRISPPEKAGNSADCTSW